MYAWLYLADACDWLRRVIRRVYLYAIERASAACYEGYAEPEPDSEGEPPS